MIEVLNFSGKELICSETAAQSFQSIIDMLAGPGELARSKELMERVRVVPDNISERTKKLLTQGGKIKERSMIIFGTGDFMKAPTVTANRGFVLSAHNQVSCRPQIIVTLIKKIHGPTIAFL